MECDVGYPGVTREVVSAMQCVGEGGEGVVMEGVGVYPSAQRSVVLVKSVWCEGGMD